MATKKKTSYRNRHFSALWTAARDLGMEKNEVYDLVEDWLGIELPTKPGGDRTASRLRTDQIEAAIENLRKMGARRPVKDYIRFEKTDEPQVRKVKAMWMDLHRRGETRHATNGALNAWVERQTKVSHLNWCSTAQLNQLIEALKEWVERANQKDA